MTSFDFIQFSKYEFLKSYGMNVCFAVDGRGLLKFGFVENLTVGVETTIMENEGSVVSETYVTDNLITHLVSDDTNNTCKVFVDGLTIDTQTNLLTRVHQTVTLNGTNKVVLPTPLARVDRLQVRDYVAEALALLSKVYAIEDISAPLGVPSDNTKIHCLISASNNTNHQELGTHQSEKTAFSLAQDEPLILSDFYAEMRSSTPQGGSADIFLKWRPIDSGGFYVFRQFLIGSITSDGTSKTPFKMSPYLIVPPNSDIVVTAIAADTGVSLSAGFSGLIGKVI